MREYRNHRDLTTMDDWLWARLLIGSAAAMTFVTFNFVLA